MLEATLKEPVHLLTCLWDKDVQKLLGYYKCCILC